MADFRGHVWGGFFATLISMALCAAGLWWTELLDPYRTLDVWPRLLLLLSIGLLSACFPDVDTESKSQRLFYRLLILLDIWFILIGDYRTAALLGLGAMLPLLGKHRGWTHTWLAMLLVPALFLLVPMYLKGSVESFPIVCYVVSVSAYASHLVLDGYIEQTGRRIRRLVAGN